MKDPSQKNVLHQKPRNGNSIPVMFFGSRDYAWVSNESIKPYEQHKKDFIKKKNTALFDKAVQQANDPSVLEKEIAREKEEYEEEEIEEEEEEIEEEEDEKPRKTNKRGKRATKAEPARKRRKEESSSSKNASNKSQNNQKAIKKEKQDKKGDESEMSGDHSEKKKEHKHKRHGSPSNYIYLKTRARIQKLLTADFNDKHIRQRASDLLDEADRIPMTLEILKDTKIGKVVKKFSQIEIKNDTLNLTKRATDLLVKWKSVVVPHHSSKLNDSSTPMESSEQIDPSENETSIATTKLSENEEEESTSDKIKSASTKPVKEEHTNNAKPTEIKMVEDKPSLKKENQETKEEVKV